MFTNAEAELRRGELLRLWSVPQEAEGGDGAGQNIRCATAGPVGRKAQLEDRPEITSTQPPQ